VIAHLARPRQRARHRSTPDTAGLNRKDMDLEGNSWIDHGGAVSLTVGKQIR
jgi:hypothetical protein